jgi:hypothetical protein
VLQREHFTLRFLGFLQRLLVNVLFATAAAAAAAARCGGGTLAGRPRRVFFARADRRRRGRGELPHLELADFDAVARVLVVELHQGLLQGRLLAEFAHHGLPRRPKFGQAVQQRRVVVVRVVILQPRKKEMVSEHEKKKSGIRMRRTRRGIQREKKQERAASNNVRC